MHRSPLFAAGVGSAVGAVFAALLSFASLVLVTRGTGSPLPVVLLLCASAQLGLSGSGAIAVFRRRRQGRNLVAAGSAAGLSWVLAWVIGAGIQGGDKATALVLAYCVAVPALGTLGLAVLSGRPQQAPRAAVPASAPAEREAAGPLPGGRTPHLRLLTGCAAIGVLFGAFGVLAACSTPSQSIQLPALPGLPQRSEPATRAPAPPSDLPSLPTELPSGLPTLPTFPGQR